MSKNIIICCDGTGNKLTIGEKTNVIHLYNSLVFNNDQIGYYSPGVGTIAPDEKTKFQKTKKLCSILKDAIKGTSLENNVIDAYKYLMDNYLEGDKIFLFGFSRGAYTVRKLSGVLQMFVLLHRGNSNHLRYILEVYSKGEKMFAVAEEFTKIFAKPVEIEFLGIWDTVVSKGGLINWYKSFPYSRELSICKVVRHAVAIDERRKHFKYSETDPKHKNQKQVFFAGVHCDIGGGYPEEGLSKICFEWIIREVRPLGLHFDDNKFAKIVSQHPINISQKLHDSLTVRFKIADLIPRFRLKRDGKKFHWKLDCSLWPLRKIPEGSLIHQSVFDKINLGDYQPQNLPINFRIEI